MLRALRNQPLLGILAGAVFAAAAVPSLATEQSANAQQQAPPPITWRPWNDKLFRDAKQTKRYIILDLNARWCHWCHFMEKRTYAHPEIRRIIDTGYLATKVDQDANPDLASRYGDWGWPATIIFDPNGKEVTKLQGFQRPSRMYHILYTILAHPDRVPQLPPEPSAKAGKSLLGTQQRERLVGLLDDTYDKAHDGWGRRLKFLQPEVVEYALKQARDGSAEMTSKVRRTLDAALALIDPVWGGIYQYSHERDWSAPHYEKIMASQVNAIRLYTQAYRQFGEQRYLDAARRVGRYLMQRLRSPEGAFYTSQDADVDHDLLGEAFYKLDNAARLKLGKAPPIDTNIYARENGWAARGMLALYAATGEAAYRAAAKTALEWTVAHRTRATGGFAHGAKDPAGPYLSDTLAMGDAMLAFYMASGDVTWLKRAGEAADFITKTFQHPEAGFVTVQKPAVRAATFAKPFVNIEENAALARFANLLYRTSGAERYRDVAAHAMRHLTSDAVVGRRRFMLGTVLADDEMAIEPAHVTIVGKAGDSAADALHRAALSLPVGYRRIDRWDPASGPMLNPDVQYPAMEQAAAFACANQICSLPVFSGKDLMQTVAKMMRLRRGNRR
ncbi:MAG: DUF255 domain-containing protein [Hyphomicrobiaceae bacterium]